MFGVAFFVLWVAAFGRLWPAVLSAFLLFAWWWPVELYLRQRFGTPMAPQLVGMALESNVNEMGEFLVTFNREILLGLLLLGLLGAPALVLTRRYPLRWRHRSRWWCLVVFPAVATLMYVTFQLQEPAWLKPTEDPFRVEPLAFWSDKWRNIFPLTLPLAVARFREDALRVDAMRDQVSAFRFGAAKAQAPLDAVVLVIGESARADRFSLNGYARKTNPLLEKRANLVLFSNVVSPSVATRFAVPFIVSRRPLLLPDGNPSERPEPSLDGAFNEAGYRSMWLSNQSSSGFWDTTTALYARDAQTVRFMNPSAAEHRGNHDEALVGPFANRLREPGPQLIVVHTMGSHFNYANRYPSAFDRFQPSLTTQDAVEPTDAQRATSASNSYDNTILYTDYILDKLIQELNQGRRRTVLAYVSDHGEDMDDVACPQRGGVRRESRWSYRVPALIWISDALAKENPALLAQLRARSAEPFESDAVFPTLLEIAGVVIPDAARTGKPNLLSPSARSTPRRIVSKAGRWVDFDAAERADACSIGPN